MMPCALCGLFVQLPDVKNIAKEDILERNFPEGHLAEMIKTMEDNATLGRIPIAQVQCLPDKTLIIVVFGFPLEEEAMLEEFVDPKIASEKDLLSTFTRNKFTRKPASRVVARMQIPKRKFVEVEEDEEEEEEYDSETETETETESDTDSEGGEVEYVATIPPNRNLASNVQPSEESTPETSTPVSAPSAPVSAPSAPARLVPHRLPCNLPPAAPARPRFSMYSGPGRIVNHLGRVPAGTRRRLVFSDDEADDDVVHISNRNDF